jgi:hypothetical protein
MRKRPGRNLEEDVEHSSALISAAYPELAFLKLPAGNLGPEDQGAGAVDQPK